MSDARKETVSRSNEYYRDHYYMLMIALIAAIIAMLFFVSIVLYQVLHRPLPQFFAKATNGKTLELDAFDEPNLLPKTILKWVSKAAVAAYTFDFVNYDKQIANVRPYFTDPGWVDYQNSVRGLIQTIAQNQLFVNGVVSGAPVIANQGPLPGHGYVWRVQLPFLVTYQSSETTTQRRFTITITLVRVPTWKNPDAIGIDQFVMT